MRRALVPSFVVLAAQLLAAGGLPAQEAPTSSPTPAPARAPRAVVPELDFYFPEGELDIRLNRLIKNALFLGQVRYNFAKGDILALLRYRYYGLERIYELSVFDELNFDRVEQVSNDFNRVRGGLFLLEMPIDPSHRASFLAEVDRISSNKEEFQFTTNRTNTFLRAAYQYGTSDDTRSNALIGDQRGRIERLFTAFRRIGPEGVGLTGALTWSFDELGADFSYLKLEAEGLKRWQLGGGKFLVGRLHAGSFPDYDVAQPGQAPIFLYTIPIDELFRLDGRDRLKGLDDKIYGTHEVHSTVEVFFPWFVGDSRRLLWVDWETWYWVIYGGAGLAGFEERDLGQLDDYVTDLGFGFESSFRVRGVRVFAAGVVAHALDERGGWNVRFSLKSSSR